MLQLRLFRSIAALALALAFIFSLHPADAADFKVLHAFKGRSDGKYPKAGVTADNTGNLYGTSFGISGGPNPGKHCGKSCGNLFGYQKANGESPLFSFNGKNGANPAARLFNEGGVLYGTTQNGGNYGGNCEDIRGCGVVFQTTTDGTQKVIYKFCSLPNCADGAEPVGGVVTDKAGNLYGATYDGGNQYRAGVVYKIEPNGTESVLYAFCPTGYSPCPQGQGPTGDFVIDSAGNLYGTTDLGGMSSVCAQYYPGGCGTIFKVAPDGTESVVYSFCSQAFCADGAFPASGVIADNSNNLYGTTHEGGGGVGTVYRLAPDEGFTVLYTFCYGCGDGVPAGNLAMDKDGNLYGATSSGGEGTCYEGSQVGCGTIYQIAPDGTKNTLHEFCLNGDCSDGLQPNGGLVLVKNRLFGTAQYGGNLVCDDFSGCGTIFELKK